MRWAVPVHPRQLRYRAPTPDPRLLPAGNKLIFGYFVTLPPAALSPMCMSLRSPVRRLQPTHGMLAGMSPRLSLKSQQSAWSVLRSMRGSVCGSVCAWHPKLCHPISRTGMQGCQKCTIAWLQEGATFTEQEKAERAEKAAGQAVWKAIDQARRHGAWCLLAAAAACADLCRNFCLA
jgi:hypothetical protein